VSFDALPASASWRHEGLRSGFEVAAFRPSSTGVRIEGTTTGLQEGTTWVVSYVVELDPTWRTRRARIELRTALGFTERLLQLDGAGVWLVDGIEAADLAGCLDVDLESSVVTNTMPVHRLGLAVGDRASAPAAYFRVDTGAIERLDQSYLRIEDVDGGQRYEYQAPIFDFRCQLVYDRSGLIVEYPGLGVRAS
jgi:hypothetical protein